MTSPADWRVGEMFSQAQLDLAVAQAVAEGDARLAQTVAEGDARLAMANNRIRQLEDEMESIRQALAALGCVFSTAELRTVCRNPGNLLDALVFVFERHANGIATGLFL